MTTAPAPASNAEIEAIYNARLDSEKSRFNEADVRFFTGMISHHTQALIMAGFAPTHGASPSLQTLAARITNAQKGEILIMQRWLEERGQPVPEVHIMGTEVMIEGAGHAMNMDMTQGGQSMLMPGMLTQDQMKELDAARGLEFDRLFLKYMIQHHTGAITMVHTLMATDGAAQGNLTFKLASDIQADQTNEITRMQRMLAALPAEGDGQ